MKNMGLFLYMQWIPYLGFYRLFVQSFQIKYWIRIQLKKTFISLSLFFRTLRFSICLSLRVPIFRSKTLFSIPPSLSLSQCPPSFLLLFNIQLIRLKELRHNHEQNLDIPSSYFLFQFHSEKNFSEG